MSDQKRQVLVIDSGVGGLTVAKEIMALIPNASIAYFADHGYFPYGDKDEAWLVNRLVDLLRKGITRFNPDVLVIACNTASTTVLPHLRQRFSRPIVGVVPAIKPASQHSQKKQIGLLATTGTVSRSYTDRLIADFASDCQVIAVGSQELVHMAESKIQGQAVDHEKLREICRDFLNDHGEPRVDVVVLGCTHFPVLRIDFEQAVSDEIRWIDSGEAIAQRVKSLMPNELAAASGSHIFLTSDDRYLSSGLTSYLRNMGFSDMGLG
ncbi:glutamate racemase [Pseudobacteriovorax antillogorgiicola]|uniref:Glutamate racemase n=1 Tax=Pseudobacteriovorax antillogorgiicola TaxID=1513793 RepID=A0A1Y6BNH6_9BACT|nr:glutamate racemase [Pseudobacteriovorax antillogorgiicola]TCS53879.1 glutamate racemase [Pseudobacteriovorax antillogorgiicola]SMF21152.1 glutamate racemase [Pseudobacteriovorax antillogorgiicola]